MPFIEPTNLLLSLSGEACALRSEPNATLTLAGTSEKPDLYADVADWSDAAQPDSAGLSGQNQPPAVIEFFPRYQRTGR